MPKALKITARSATNSVLHSQLGLAHGFDFTGVFAIFDVLIERDHHVLAAFVVHFPQGSHHGFGTTLDAAAIPSLIPAVQPI